MNKKRMSRLVWDGKCRHTPRRFLARNKKYIADSATNADSISLSNMEKLEKFIREQLEKSNKNRREKEAEEDKYWEEFGDFIEKNPIGGHLRDRGQSFED